MVDGGEGRVAAVMGKDSGSGGGWWVVVIGENCCKIYF